VDRSAPKDDEAGAEKPDARDDLSCDARWVDDNEARLQDVEESVLADQKDQRGGGADDGLGAQSGALALDVGTG
jgi:hypothetical protein